MAHLADKEPEAEALLRQGLSVEKIHKQIGIATSRIMKLRRKLGLYKTDDIQEELRVIYGFTHREMQPDNFIMNAY